MQLIYNITEGALSKHMPYNEMKDFIPRSEEAQPWEYLQNYATKHKAKGNGFGYGMATKDGVTRTLSAQYCKDGS